MALVKSYTSGNTKIRIHDDYTVKTPEEVKEILSRLGKIVSRWGDDTEN